MNDDDAETAKIAEIKRIKRMVEKITTERRRV